jgi:hypothetical protein
MTNSSLLFSGRVRRAEGHPRAALLVVSYRFEQLHAEPHLHWSPQLHRSLQAQRSPQVQFSQVQASPHAQRGFDSMLVFLLAMTLSLCFVVDVMSTRESVAAVAGGWIGRIGCCG